MEEQEQQAPFTPESDTEHSSIFTDIPMINIRKFLVPNINNWIIN